MSRAISCVQSILQTCPSDSASMFFEDVVKRYTAISGRIFHSASMVAPHLHDNVSKGRMTAGVSPGSIQEDFDVFRCSVRGQLALEVSLWRMSRIAAYTGGKSTRGKVNARFLCFCCNTRVEVVG